MIPRSRRNRPSRTLSRVGVVVALTFAPAIGAEAPRPVTPYALHDAARDGDLEEVARLLDAGVPPGALRPGDRSCALGVAANQGHAAIVELLLAAGADPGCGWPQWPPLVSAARGGHLAAVERLLEGGAGSAEALGPALRTAAEAGHPKTARRLVAAGAPLEGRDESGMTPLLLAARAGRPATVAALLDAGAKIDAVDPAGRGALHWASWRRRVDVVRVLVARGAPADRADAAGDRPFLDAPDLESALARMEAAAVRAAETARCASILLPASAGARGAGTVTAWGAPWSPEPDAPAWFLDPDGTSRAARVAGAELDECAARWWAPLLVPRDGEPVGVGGDWSAVLGRAETVRAVATPPRADLPWGLFPETVERAVDLDDDGRADLLLRSFCCRADWIPAAGPPACDYTCWESWSRAGGEWALCAADGPC